MLPKKSRNIYPKNEINIKAVLDFYFHENENILYGDIEHILLHKKRTLSLNQIEFISRKINEAYSNVFKKNLNGEMYLTNLFQYAIDVFTKNESDWRGSKSRLKITREFRDFIRSTEVDIGY